MNVGWYFNAALEECANLAAADATEEVPKLENYVLPGAGPRMRRIARGVTNVVCGEENNRETNVTVRLELLDERPTLIRLLMENDGIEFELLEKPATTSFSSSSFPWTRKIRRLAGDLAACGFGKSF